MRGKCAHTALLIPSTSVAVNNVTAAVLLLILSMICCHCGTGIAFEQTGRDVLDLLQGLNSTSAHESLSGLRFSSGPNDGPPILLLEDNNRYISLPDEVVAQTVRLLRDHNEITFLCSVRQDEGDSGTLIALASNTTRSLFLELESSGRRNELRLHYRHQGQVRVETFHYKLADGKWHTLALTISGDQVAIFVDCNRIYRRVVPAMDRPPLNPRSLTLTVGQRNRHQALFRGALQDVKIVTRAHGYLLQCPNEDTECPTCANFQDLEKRVKEMSSMYKDLTNQLIRAEERLSDLEQCQCSQYCHDNGTQRKDGEEWLPDKCNVCKCKNGTVECNSVECPQMDCKNPVYRDGECCPVCPTYCYYLGKYYDHGETVSPTVCVTCICKNGQMGECEKQDPKLTCPTLHCPESERIEIHGQCCSVCKGTDFCASGHTCHSNASCINLATKSVCQCHPGFKGDGNHCEDIDECQETGGRQGHHCPPNNTCVNTPGSYRCDCVKGHRRLDSHECKDIDECLHGDHTCDSNADCVNVNGSYQCRCYDGFEGDGYGCKPHCNGECRNGGMCIAPNICECRHGYIGPVCELDIDECSLGIAKCHDYSICVNVPGWYRCDCVEGYHSSWDDNQLGSMCFDIDECHGEGEGHTCHPSMECVNTDGGYMCQCKSPGSCRESCLFEGSEHINGSKWKSVVDHCTHCQCEAGRAICHHDPCDCHDQDVDPTCCPSCDVSNTCRHQEHGSMVYHSGDTWIYQCQTCECLHGETDCWPMHCPSLSCQNAIRRPGDCCPVCEDSNQCTTSNLETGGQDLSQTTCSYQGEDYIHGEEWTLESDPCTSCQCKAGHICCTFSQSCSTPYS